MPRFQPRALALISMLCLIIFNLAACGSPTPPQGKPPSGKAGGAPPEMPPIPVQLSEVSQRVATESSVYLGKVTSRHSIDMYAQVESRLQSVLVQPGQYVKAGQTLFVLEGEPQKALVASLQSGAEVARQQLNSSQTELNAIYRDREVILLQKTYLEKEALRLKGLETTGSVSNKDLHSATTQALQANAQLAAINNRVKSYLAHKEQAKAQLSQNSLNAKNAAAQLNYYTVRAPFSGQLGEVSAKQGDYIRKDKMLTQLTGSSDLELDLAVPAEDALQLKSGLTVELLGKEGKVLGQSKLFFVSPTVDTISQTVQAKAKLNLPHLQLRNQQQLQTRLLWREAEGLFVPVAAVVRKQGQAMVYVGEVLPASEVKLPPGMPPLPGPVYKVRLQPVSLGAIQGQFYQITSGLEAGQKVVSAGVMKLQQPNAKVFEEPKRAQ